MNKTIYFDNQATTPIDSSVLDEMLPYFGSAFGNPHSNNHIIGWKAAKAVEASLKHIGELIGADEDEIVFTSGATEANNLALLGVGRKGADGDRNRILVSATEHKSVLETSRYLQQQLGYSVEILPVNHSGFVNLDFLQETLSNDVLLVSIILVNNEIGTIQDIPTISKLVREHGALFHSDAAQAPTAITLTEAIEHLDLLSLSGHKMYGPQGIGVLYIRREIQKTIEPMIYGGEQQRGIRSGTLPLPLCVGMGAAASRLNCTRQPERDSICRRTAKFIELLSNQSYSVVLNGPSNFEMRHPGNANLQFVGFEAEDILNALQPRVAASTGSACTTGIPESSHVLSAIGLTREQANSAIRFSLGKDTKDDDVSIVVQLINDVLLRLSSNNSN